MGFFSDMLSTSAGEHQVNSTGIRCCATCNNWSGSRRPNCFGSLVEAFEESGYCSKYRMDQRATHWCGERYSRWSALK